jgi:membrane protease YdiL (CAAX protease family)
VVSGALFWAGFALLVILTAAGLRYYLPLARRVLVEDRGRVEDGWVQPLDGAVALLLCFWFLMLGYGALTQESERTVGFGDVVNGAIIYASIVIFLLGLLVYRNIPPSGVFGLGGEKFFPVLGRALLALLAAYPVLMLVQSMVFGISGGNLQPQEVVEFLQNADTPRDRIAVMVMAVVVAPVAEEMIFRGYLYPAGKRYLGPFLSLGASSLLFAALHGHMASVPALFTLAICLGLAYEKTGTLLVPMVMHAVFNAVSVAAILFLL